jgi:hypothetical protein
MRLCIFPCSTPLGRPSLTAGDQSWVLCQCFLIASALRNIRRQRSGSIWHINPSAYTGNGCTGWITWLGTSNPLAYWINPAQLLTSSATPSACLRLTRWARCKWLLTWLGKIPCLHCLQTANAYSTKCSKYAPATLCSVMVPVSQHKRWMITGYRHALWYKWYLNSAKLNYGLSALYAGVNASYILRVTRPTAWLTCLIAGCYLGMSPILVAWCLAAVLTSPLPGTPNLNDINHNCCGLVNWVQYTMQCPD